MHDSAKYLIHADIRASGVVERSDVVGAVFGQTEGLLGDELDLRDLQDSQKLGRIDVEIASEDGQSFGEITIASGLDRVETAILAAALESIERVGPCRADVEITDLEDVRTAKRRGIVDRATELLVDFDESALSSQDIVEEVREAVRVEDIGEFHGFPAGPRVGESDAVIVVEGRSDVLTLLQYGVKNAIAVEGTDVPDAVATLTSERTVTAFLDGDRGGDLILKELAQVGDIDHVALAPPGRSVEDLSRGEAMEALREKVPFEAVDGEGDAGAEVEAMAATDGSARPAPERPSAPADSTTSESTIDPDTTTAPDAAVESDPEDKIDAVSDPEAVGEPESGDSSPASSAVGAETGDDDTGTATTLAGHVAAVVGDESGTVRALDADFGVVAERAASDAFDLLDELDEVPTTVVLDGDCSQRLLDVAAQRGVEQVVARSEGEYVKRPASVRIRLAADVI